jgi:hypothetical protein
MLPMARVKSPIYEYTCHEGNYGIANVLSEYRAHAKKAKEPSGTKSK